MRWTEIAEKIELQKEIVEKLAECEKTLDCERLQADIEALSDPERTARAYEALRQKLDPDEGNVKMELCQLLAAERMRDKYRALGICEEIFLATMRAFPRFLEETRVYRGAYEIDRTYWSYRQVGMTLFRVGALEYELRRDTGCVSIHIPSDADFSPASVDSSIEDAKRFIQSYFPAFAGAPIVCHSWLMSGALKPLLPDSSNIIQFQKRFRVTDEERESDGCIRFLFQMTEDTPLADLRENTSLQRKVKALLLRGEKIGTARGVLI